MYRKGFYYLEGVLLLVLAAVFGALGGAFLQASPPKEKTESPDKASVGAPRTSRRRWRRV